MTKEEWTKKQRTKNETIGWILWTNSLLGKQGIGSTINVEIDAPILKNCCDHTWTDRRVRVGYTLYNTPPRKFLANQCHPP